SRKEDIVVKVQQVLGGKGDFAAIKVVGADAVNRQWQTTSIDEQLSVGRRQGNRSTIALSCCYADFSGVIQDNAANSIVGHADGAAITRDRPSPGDEASVNPVITRTKPERVGAVHLYLDGPAFSVPTGAGVEVAPEDLHAAIPSRARSQVELSAI